ncbi:hypothetical protein KSP39_PZI011318 [Platanthera zijinensis]|uniref:Uncharacterized protein n=1 Tax=Platanthera zijinensis TaxID=2320716 RepID=A0AAP0G635_9ASPA
MAPPLMAPPSLLRGESSAYIRGSIPWFKKNHPNSLLHHRPRAKRERNRGGAAAVAASTQRRSSGGLEVVPAKVLCVHLVAQVERHSGGGRFVPIIAAAAAPRFTDG